MASSPRTGQPPQRTCIACRTSGDKRGLLRIVRSPEGVVELDLRGKKAGRGAYICRQADCWEQALKKGRLETALKTKLSPDSRLALSEFAAKLRETITV